MTQVWVGVLVLTGNVVQKIFPVRRFGRFYHRRFERRQLVLIPSAFMYITSFFRRLYHKKSQSDFWKYKERALSLVQKTPQITWIGHATFLIQLSGITILTDPIFGDATFLFKRIVAPTISIEALPSIDYILISHNHRDHMDTESLMRIKNLYPNVKVLVPEGDKAWFIKHNFTHVTECEWWESFTTGSCKFTFLPAYHWSGRGIHDRNKSLWGSWMVESSEKTIYFAGDTAYWKHFVCIRHYFPSIDIALIPIGPCKPIKYMRKSHLNAYLAVKAFIELGAKKLIPMHWGTFYFGTDYFTTPIELLQQAWQAQEYVLANKVVLPLKLGESSLL